MANKPFDYRSGTRKDAKGKILRQPKIATEDSQNFKWWEAEDSDMAGAIAATLKFMQSHQNGRIEQLTVSTRLYGSTSAYSLLGTGFTRTAASSASSPIQRISYNLCSSVIDTLESKLAKNKVLPVYITNGGDWDSQKKAKQLTKFTQGLFHAENVHKKIIRAFFDSGVWGDGFLQVFRKDDKVCIERVLPHELWVDQVEGIVCEDPSQMHRPKIMDRATALSMYPELKDAIMSSSPANYDDIGAQGSAADLIVVIESWHLRSGPKAKDGLHVISINDQVLTEPYKKDFFPFPHFRYVERPIGWYGQGACERLQNLQGEINRCMILKQRSMHMMASFKILLENGSKVVTQHLNNEVGSIIHFTGTAPQYVTPPATNPELQQWIDSLIEKGYRQEGVSQLSTTGEAPMGIESGKALTALTQIADDRFLRMGQRLEEFALEIARQAIEVVKDIYKDKGTYEVAFPSNNFMETVDWKSINLDEDQYVLKAYPISSLSEDFSGRLSEVQEGMQAGLISPEAGKRLLQFPDIEMYAAIDNAPEDIIRKVIEDILYEGEYRAPEPTWNLVLAQKLSLQYMSYAELCNAPGARLNLLRNFLAQISDINAQAAQPAMHGQGGAQVAGAPGPMTGAPMAAPQAPPTNNMIPNVPGAA